MALHHHDLCFGCGQTNLFGLLLEVDRTGGGAVAGRCFIKQDHQGPDRTAAHQGVVAAALCEAMALACGPQARAATLEVELVGAAPVGTFLDVQASTGPQCDGLTEANATATSEGRIVARARGRFRSGPPPTGTV
jgi:hypothetical protein